MNGDITVRIVDAVGEGVLATWRSTHAGYQVGDALSLEEGGPDLKVLARRWAGPHTLELNVGPWR